MDKAVRDLNTFNIIKIIAYYKVKIILNLSQKKQMKNKYKNMNMMKTKIIILMILKDNIVKT